MKQVFVYGTLLTGEPNHRLVGGLVTERIPAVLEGVRLFDTGRGYPAAAPGQGKVEGELLRFGPAFRFALEIMDELEGYHGPGREDNEYDRLACSVILAEGRESAYTYMAATMPRLARPIPDGSWRRHRRGEVLVFRPGAWGPSGRPRQVRGDGQVGTVFLRRATEGDRLFSVTLVRMEDGRLVTALEEPPSAPET